MLFEKIWGIILTIPRYLSLLMEMVSIYFANKTFSCNDQYRNRKSCKMKYDIKSNLVTAKAFKFWKKDFLTN